MGQFVEKLPKTYISVGTPWSLISDRIDEVQSYANEWAGVLSDSIHNLEDGVKQYVPNFSNIDYNSKGINTPQYPNKPDLSIDLNNDWPDTNIPEPIIKDTFVGLSFVDPIKPSGIDSGFSYTPGVYNSQILDDLLYKIKDSLISGGTGLNDIVYNLIIDRDKESRRIAENRVRQKLLDDIGSRGFDLPGGMISAAILDIEKDILLKDIDSINSITIKDFDLADSNAKFSKEIAIKMEELLRGAFESSENRLFDIAKTSEELIISTYEYNIKLYLAEWDGIKSKLESAKTQLDSIISYNDNQIKVFTGRAEVLKSKIISISEENRSKSDNIKTSALVYETEVNAISTQFKALVEEVSISLEEYKTKVDAVISIEDINLRATESASELSAQISTSIANIASQSVASALGAINTSMNYGYSGSTSASTVQSISNSLSEDHSYEGS